MSLLDAANPPGSTYVRPAARAVKDFAALCEREHYFAIRFTPVAVRSRD